MWESRRDFQEVWEGWKAGILAFHAFHASVISMACFGSAFHKFTIRREGPFLGNRNHLSEKPTIHSSELAERNALQPASGWIYRET